MDDAYINTPVCVNGDDNTLFNGQKAWEDYIDVQAVFGVFDGHRGAKAAVFAAENLSKNIMCELMKGEGDNIEEAIKNGYLATDSKFLKEGTMGGTCCVTAFILNEHLIVSNAGDCRAVVSRGGVAEALTSDHRPSREDEKERIESLFQMRRNLGDAEVGQMADILWEVQDVQLVRDTPNFVIWGTRPGEGFTVKGCYDWWRQG
ncbi:putative protein phosphatase 2C 2 [Acorus calamus]|uniref:protein-serine/threonine phosphatase n=1 Tax=Acorus calamus TaxID=4465 RepID=A0AAV9E2X6_ACOCL|nr:putative protein phosphatase 2C 2 [Acorus calamus]